MHVHTRYNNHVSPSTSLISCYLEPLLLEGFTKSSPSRAIVFDVTCKITIRIWPSDIHLHERTNHTTDHDTGETTRCYKASRQGLAVTTRHTTMTDPHNCSTTLSDDDPAAATNATTCYDMLRLLWSSINHHRHKLVHWEGRWRGVGVVVCQSSDPNQLRTFSLRWVEQLPECRTMRNEQPMVIRICW